MKKKMGEAWTSLFFFLFFFYLSFYDFLLLLFTGKLCAMYTYIDARCPPLLASTSSNTLKKERYKV